MVNRSRCGSALRDSCAGIFDRCAHVDQHMCVHRVSGVSLFRISEIDSCRLIREDSHVRSVEWAYHCATVGVATVSSGDGRMANRDVVMRFNIHNS